MNARVLRRITLTLLSVLGLCAASSADALFRTYVASDGNDLNDCSLSTPCRLLPRAITQTDINGEIWMLDSANYNSGTVTVNKSLTILAIPGAVGSVVAQGGGDAISVAGGGLRVTLRNLVFVNLTGNPGVVAVNFTQGTSLTIIDSSFTALTVGVKVNNPLSKTQIINSTFNGNAIGLQNLGGIVNVDNSSFTNNGIAINANGAGYGGGTSGNATAIPQGTTQVRLSGGNVWDNSIAFKMDNPGNRISGQCNGTNIFLAPTVYRFANGILGNTTFLQVTGSADTNGGCGGSVTIDSWQPQTQNSSPL
jgi:hypothetical protein